ncbi:hypothetical protein [Providencia stuartii]|uniref:hypothetical protein n=1 Tax=Providencia stuartii TaxID=588 RepID=UPI00160548F7|nr:hypothetical protein [Providencia stuartii]
MKKLLFIISILCSSAYATNTVTWCSPEPNPVTGKPDCITYTPGMRGIDSGGEGP